MTKDIHFLSFATSNWHKSKERILKQTAELNSKSPLFSTVTFVTEQTIGQEYFDSLPLSTSVENVGYYFWSWKPYIILKELEKIPENKLFSIYGRGL